MPVIEMLALPLPSALPVAVKVVAPSLISILIAAPAGAFVTVAVNDAIIGAQTIGIPDNSIVGQTTSTVNGPTVISASIQEELKGVGLTIPLMKYGPPLQKESSKQLLAVVTVVLDEDAPKVLLVVLT